MNIDIATIASPSYVGFSGAMLKSALRASGGGIHVHLISFPMARHFRHNLEADIARWGGEISFYELDGHSQEFAFHLTTELSLKLRLAETLKELKKVLFLDSDLLVRKGLGELFDTNLQGNTVSACLDHKVAGWREHNNQESSSVAKASRKDFRNFEDYIRGKLRMRKKDKYFNSGVMLLDLALLREEELSWGDPLGDKRAKILFGDQCILNAKLKGKVMFLPETYNFCPWPEAERLSWSSRLQTNFQVSSVDPAIVHFAGPSKPWSRVSSNPFSYLFWEAAGL